MRDWRLQSPVKVIEKVKAMLLAERTGAEWEMLEGNEWEEEDAQADAPMHHREGDAGKVPKIEETGVLVPARPEAVGASYVGGAGRLPRIEETGVLVPGQGDRMGSGGDGEGEDMGERGKGRSGWMKLKSR